MNLRTKYDFVVYKDFSADFAFLTRSTKTSDKTIKWEDGKDYPVVEVEISSATHPFYTGQQRLVDTAGRIEKFKKKYAKTSPAKK